jgi:hypothetical protein
LILFLGGSNLLVQLFAFEENAKSWIRSGGILRQLAIACALIYTVTIILGAITLFPEITTNAQTAILLIIYGLGFVYLSWCIWKVRRTYPATEHAQRLEEDSSLEKRSSMFQEASLPLSLAILILLGILLTFLGLLLFPVNLGLLPFSPDGQLGLLLTVMAIQIMSLGETPLGQFRRSLPIMLLGLVFAGLGVVSSIVPGLLTGMIRMLLGILNVVSGTSSLARRYLLMPRNTEDVPQAPAVALSRARKVLATQTALNWVTLTFGIATLFPGLVPGLVVAIILIVNGMLLFRLASNL